MTGAIVSTVMVWAADHAETFPAGSVARKLTLCGPSVLTVTAIRQRPSSASAAVVTGVRASTRTSTVEPGSVVPATSNVRASAQPSVSVTGGCGAVRSTRTRRSTGSEAAPVAPTATIRSARVPSCRSVAWTLQAPSPPTVPWPTSRVPSRISIRVPAGPVPVSVTLPVRVHVSSAGDVTAGACGVYASTSKVRTAAGDVLPAASCAVAV